MNNINQQIVLKDGRILGYAIYGMPNGDPIIYCHGSQSSRLEMHYDMSFAVDNGLKIITVDRPGHGMSDFNPTGTILDFTQDVNQLADHLKIDKFAVAGMSAGAPFALGIAFSFPEKVQKVSIISGFAPYDVSSKKHLKKKVRTMLNLAKSMPFILRMLLKVQSKQLMKNPKKSLKAFLKIMSDPDQEILKNKSVMEVVENMFIEAFRHGSRGVAYEISYILVQDWHFALNEIKVPVAFWHGNNDNNVPLEWAELMKNEIQNSTLNIYEGEGHLIIFDHAEEIFTS